MKTLAAGLKHGLAIAALLAIASVFWLESRYPNLQDKALMGEAIKLQDPLSFEARFELDPTWQVWKKIFYTSVNWVYTNRRGMMFGVLFGSAALTLLGYLKQRKFKSPFGNAALGLFVGAPLGVCVNCAAPIGIGLFRGGMSVEAAMAAMIASPTLNVVVVSMAFALMPFHVAVLKTAMALSLVLIIVPLISRRLSDENNLDMEKFTNRNTATVVSMGYPAVSSGNSFADFLRDFAWNLWLVARLSIPMMLLAGVIGAAAATLVPIESVAYLGDSLMVMIAAAAVGVFAPVPMAFDVVLSAALLQSGATVAVVTVLLCSLGSFSIYSYMIIAGMVSRRLANGLALAVVLTSLAAGLVAGAYDTWQMKRAMELLNVDAAQFNFISSAHAANSSSGSSADVMRTEVTVKASPFIARRAVDTKFFRRTEAWKLGVDRPNGFAMQFMNRPFYNIPGSISAADMDNDGDDDVVMSSTTNLENVLIFDNDGAGIFAKRALVHPDLADEAILSALPFDVDNDGWADLFLATAQNGNFIWYSARGQFPPAALLRIENLPAFGFTQSAGFADLDRNGLLDIALGNAEGSDSRMIGSDLAQNIILLNRNGRVDGANAVVPDGPHGDTLVTLFGDFNRDGFVDFAEGNKSIMPDSYFLGNGKGGLKRVLRNDALIPLTTTSTMSIRNSDLDNDGVYDLLMTQIAGRSDDLSSRLKLRNWSSYCDDVERPFDQSACARNLMIRAWYRPGHYVDDMALVRNCLRLQGEEVTACRALILRDLAVRRNRPDLCENISDVYKFIRKGCRTLMRPRMDADLEVDAQAIPQVRGRNILLKGQVEGPFLDVSKAAGIEVGGWSWDTEIFDFDNDTLQDIFIANGEWSGSQDVLESKIFFLNLGNMRFADKTEEAGVEDYLIVPSSAAADYDNDGDIDLIANSVNGPVMAYWNESQNNQSIIVELRDAVGNRKGIGSTVKITHGKESQWRQLQLSGGFNALDAPYAHFGLGGHTEVDFIEVTWSTGETDRIQGPIAARQKLTISRSVLAGQ